MTTRRPRKSQMNIAEDYISAGEDPPGFYVQVISQAKGKGVFTSEPREKGDFLLEYRGELINEEEAEKREEHYKTQDGNFMFYFKHFDKIFCVDATKTCGAIAKFANGDQGTPNANMKKVDVAGKPHLCLFASRNIGSGEEIVYDYGMGNLPSHPKVSIKVEDGKEAAVRFPDTHSEPLPCKETTNMTTRRPRKSQMNIAEDYISAGEDPPGFYVQVISQAKGNGVFTREPREKGDFLLEYRGELINEEDAEKREKHYKTQDGNFMFYFKHFDKIFCVDATKTSGSIAKFANGDQGTPNANMKKVDVSGRPHLCLFASRNIDIGEEIVYDYGLGNLSSSPKGELLNSRKTSEPPCMQDNSSEDDDSDKSITKATKKFNDLTEPRTKTVLRNQHKQNHNCRELMSTNHALICLSSEEGEAEIPQCASLPNKLRIKTSTKHLGKRKWDKKQFCLYCHKPFGKIARHLESKHGQENNVAYALSLKKKSKEMMSAFAQIRNQGNYRHNIEVLEKGEGQIIPWRQPSNSALPENYSPCPHCFAFLLKPMTMELKRPRVQSLSAMMLSLSTDVGNGTNAMISAMEQDKTAQVARMDPLIMKFAERMYLECGQDKSQHCYINQKTRELRRLLLELKLTDPTEDKLQNYIQPSKFNIVVEAVKKISGFNVDGSAIKNPLLAFKLGHSLGKVANVLTTEAIIIGDEKMRQNAENFLKRKELLWDDRISSHAIRKLDERKWNKPKAIPLTEDIIKLQKYLQVGERKSCGILKKYPCDTEWQELSQNMLAQLTLFNRRQVGDIGKMGLKNYKNIKQVSLQDYASLSDFEKDFGSTLARVDIRGKHGRIIPVLLTPEMKKSVDLLNSTRSQARINEDNPYVFARIYDSKPLRGNYCLREYAVRCEAKFPERLTSIQLRMREAIMAQLFNLSEKELDKLTNFTEHDVRVYSDVDSLENKALHLVKSSKILLAMDKGVHAYNGKPLDDNDIDTESLSEGSSAEESEESGTEETERGCGKEAELFVPATSLPAHASGEYQASCENIPKGDADGGAALWWSPPVAGPRDGRASDESGDNTLWCSLMESSPLAASGDGRSSGMSGDNTLWQSLMESSPLAASGGGRSSGMSAKGKKGVQKRPWSDVEKAAVHRHLGHFIMMSKVPGKRDCEACISREPQALKNRSWKDVKYYVYNRIQSKRSPSFASACSNNRI